MRRSVIVAETVLLKGLSSPDEVGETGADLATSGRSTSGKVREAVLFPRRENLGMGTEVGGGELE